MKIDIENENITLGSDTIAPHLFLEYPPGDGADILGTNAGVGQLSIGFNNAGPNGRQFYVYDRIAGQYLLTVGAHGLAYGGSVGIDATIALADGSTAVFTKGILAGITTPTATDTPPEVP